MLQQRPKNPGSSQKRAKKGAVTVATSMAGRGTDIKLEQDARENGGLLVVGTERMTSDRIDNQLPGALRTSRRPW